MARARKSSAALLAAVIGAAAACQAGPATTGAAVTAAPTVAATSVPTVPAPSPTPATAIVIEDAGVEVDLTPGTYTSRVFRPTVEFVLPAGWQRRRATSESTINIDRGEVTLSIVRVDFVQCGETLLSHPDAADAATLIGKTTILAPVAPTTATVGPRQGQQVDLPGTGAEAGGAIDPANGCILTAGPEPYPAEYAWVVLTSDLAVRLTFVDVGDDLVMLLGRSVSLELDAVVTATDPVVGTVEFPGSEH